MRRYPFLAFAMSALVLGGCGGGGGGGGTPSGSGGSSGGSGGSGGSGSGGSGSDGSGSDGNTLAITSANALELIDLVFNDAELLQFNAELLVSAAAVLQLSDASRIDLDCPDASGIVYIEHEDSDSSGALSVGDRVTVVLEECLDITVDASLAVTAISQMGLSFNPKFLRS